MLTISSIGVMPWPQQSPTTKAQPVTATKTSNAVSSENARPGASVVSAGDAAQVQATYSPSALPPVDPTSEAKTAITYSNAQAPERSGQVPAQQVQSTGPREDAVRVSDAQTEQVAAQPEEQASSNRSTDPQIAQQQAEEIRRFKGELPVEYRSPVQEALDTQIKDLLPNMWAASRAAVDVLIGEEARAAAAARAADVAEKANAQVAAATTDKSSEVSETYAAGQAATGGSRTPGQVVNVQA